MKTAILFTANDPQLAASHLMTQTLRDPSYGAYDQEIWVLSTSLSDRARAYLDKLDIGYHVSEMKWAEEEMDWRSQFPDLSEAEALREFRIYRNKRMSKIIYLEWFAEHGQDYDAVAISDNDLYFQHDIRPLFKHAENGRVNYTQEDYPIFPGTNLWKKDFWYRQHTGDWDYQGGRHEVNIGFVIAKPDVMATLFDEIKTRFPKLPTELIRDHAWHDQDITRVIRHERPDLFTQFPEDTILHLCGGGMDLVEEHMPGHFINRLNEVSPTIVHFGGGAWKHFRSIAPSYTVEHKDIFDDVTQYPISDMLLSLGKSTYEDGIVELSGWYVVRSTPVEIVISSQSKGVLGYAETGFSRPDVRKTYPSRHNICGGWRFTMRLPDLPEDEKIFVSLFADGTSKQLNGKLTQTASE
ncbi:hypothetical protein GFB49_14140 [Epibacterium sp. SM1979]|uniref:Uncharacterized protein n=1 Tax=Tritonibacter litoralis TaxID=2662264 RepID=A0A843YJJ7_9RHOB|nr:hypothetical protein [Tritonibacter litoralis]MQQ09604.1 hypothetical protein [Tritonibacter litoralis]